MTRLTVETHLFRVLRWVTIVFLLFATIFPFYYMVVTSVVPVQDLQLHPERLIPDLSNLTVNTYAKVLAPRASGGYGFGRFMINSGIVALISTLLTLIVVIPAAYSVSRLRFRGRRAVSLLFMIVYMFPAIILAIPLFVAFSAMGIRESLVGLIVVYVALTVPVSIYMLRQYFDSISPSIDEAAMIDGANRFQIMTRIIVPLARPTILSTALYIFMIAWNEFLFALLFLVAKRDLWTVSLGLSQLSNGVEVPKTILMAGAMLLTIPIIALYSIAERGLVEGLTAGADKG